ncbi:alpha-2-macroglobulin family protein [Aerosakkonema funiforme]|uniref:Alpha-2-macroglobulin family protein n=1 Tax=Aerosakkonema funiforme FACHB-1375 TaxID=2949571 RepID=A0A926ZGL3_9CYAN|nr:alpha-2-macroglobulin [Aerosakkonema funiforme]MBD2181674.1 alpha-2-macroglobulin family protein [Aerosakkonema funiforme FACHB-1375]
MQVIGRIVKTWMFCLALILILGMAGCGLLGITGTEPLPEVSSLPTPQLPDWIEQISPLGEAEPLAQIRIRFKEPLIPVESIDSPDRQEVLQKFAILPALPGQFRFLTPRMVGFQADKALPKATRIKVTLKKGLADLKNRRLAEDLAWTFQTESIKLTNLPGKTEGSQDESEAIDLRPTLKFTSNVELDPVSLKEHLAVTPVGDKYLVPLKVDLEKTATEQTPEEKFNPAARNWNYIITPLESLEKARTYHIEFSPGIRPVIGNLSTENKFVSEVKTYAPLAFDKIQFFGQPDVSGSYGRFVKGAAQLLFNNPIAAESAIKNITINPQPKPAPRLVQAYDGEKVINLNPWALEPAKSYTITIGRDLKDKFGQTLGKRVTLKYETGDLAGDIWAPSDLHIFPSGKNLQLNISTVNLPESQYKAAYRVVEPTDLVYVDSAYPKGNKTDLLPPPTEWQSFKVTGKKNQSTDVAVPLREKLGAATGMLAYGIQARTNRYQENNQQKWREYTTYGLVELTNLGVFAQWFPDAGLIRVNHLSDGLPVANATVEIYESQLEAKTKEPVKPCAVAKTDSTGTSLLNRQNLQQCMKSATGFAEPPQLLVIARENEDWAFTRTNEYSGSYDYGIDAGWQNDKPVSRGEIFSDRQLYQPGEKAWFTGEAYYLQNDKIRQDKNTSYQVTLRNPDGKTTDLGKQRTNEFGTFSLELPISANQPLGYYSISAKNKDGNEISGSFQVAEFKPPNFKVALTLDKEFALIDEKVTAKPVSNYLFGSPVEGGKATYYITRTPVDFTPKGWEKFYFGRQWFWPEEKPNVPSDVLQVNQLLDKEGRGNKTITVAKDLPYPMNYRVDVQISDVSNLSVADSKSFTALPSDRIIGLQSDFVADANKPFPIQVIVTDPTGKAIAGQKVRVELQQMKYSDVTQVVEGSLTARNQVEYKTIAKTELVSASTPQSVSLTPRESGSYRIRANFTDGKNELTASDVQIWVAGDSAVNWGDRYQNNRLEIKLDKETYQPGETATVLIQSPYPEAELHFAVIRHNIIYRQITKVRGSAPQIQFKVTPDMLPNAAVEAVLVRQGKPLSQSEPTNLKELVRIGFAPFNTKLDDKYLKVEVTPQQTSLQPGAEQTLQLKLTDNSGNPVKGQFTVMVVNEAVLQLSGYRPPDLVKTVYAEQTISTRFADNRPDVVLQPLSSPLEKGWGYGGGLSAGAANTRTRTDFQPLAYYSGSVLSDENGQAQVKFKLPDDLTTWRVMVVATDGNLCFGNGETTFIATQPLISNPVLPQFVRLGDRFDAGLSVTNNTQQTGNLAIAGEIDGGIQFAQNNKLQTQTESGTRAYRFPMIANSIGQTQVKFTTQLNGTTDAFAVPLEVKNLEVTEEVVESGTTTDRAKIPLKVDRNVANDSGGLEVQIASNLIPEIAAPARQVLDDNELPFLEPAASQLLIAANLQILNQKYQQNLANFNPAQQAEQAISRLQKLQKPDGGFAAWPGHETSDPFVSPYAAESLAKASAAGLKVDPAMVNRLKTYLSKILADPGQYDFCKQPLCKNQVRLQALMALAELGDKRNEFIADIYAQRNNFDFVTQIKLARYLSLFSEWQDESKTLLNQIQESVYETGRSATINLPDRWRWFDSPTTTQAQALRLFISQKSKPEVLDRLVQSLLSLRRNGTWPNTYDNAEALTALVAYAQLQPTPPNFTATVELAGKQLASTRFQGYRQSSQDVQVPMAQLPRGQHDLILKKSGQGTLHYLAAYRYRLPGNQPGRLNGLRVVREIRAANQDKVLRKIGLYAVDEPLKLPSGQVFDIGLEIFTDRPVDHLIVTDYLPAGFEAVDGSFQTATPYFQAQGDSWELDYKTIYRDRILAYGDRLEAGVYSLHYLVRSVTPGTFIWPGAEVRLQYAPEEFGRSAASTLVISDR